MKTIFFVLTLLITTSIFANSYFPFDHNLQTKETTNIKKQTHHHHHISESTSTINTVFLWGIRFFQIFISPQDGPNCIYYPTCSMYGYLSIKKYGPIIGLLMTSDRWLRCNPFGYPEYDPPEYNYIFKKEKKNDTGNKKFSKLSGQTSKTNSK